MKEIFLKFLLRVAVSFSPEIQTLVNKPLQANLKKAYKLIVVHLLGSGRKGSLKHANTYILESVVLCKIQTSQGDKKTL